MRSLLAVAVASVALACSVPALAQTDVPAEAAPAAQPAPEAPAEKPAEAAAEKPAEAAAPAADASASAEPAYVGTWADNPEQCSKPQDDDDAPMIVAKNRFDQHEAHCEFTTVSANQDEWKVSAKCSVEGDEQPDDFGMSVAEKELTMIDDIGTQTYMRCP